MEGLVVVLVVGGGACSIVVDSTIRQYVINASTTTIIIIIIGCQPFFTYFVRTMDSVCNICFVVIVVGTCIVVNGRSCCCSGSSRS